jgi:repressor LexA
MTPKIKIEGTKGELILRTIEHYQRERGWPPSIRELADEAQLSSPASVHRWLKLLEELGYIKRGEGPRQVAVVSPRVGEGGGIQADGEAANDRLPSSLTAP